MDAEPKTRADKNVEWCLTTTVGRAVPSVDANLKALRLLWRRDRRP